MALVDLEYIIKKNSNNMRLRMISIRKNDIRCFLLWLLSIVFIIWVNDNAYDLKHCVNRIQKNYKKIIKNSNDGEIITIKATCQKIINFTEDRSLIYQRENY